jgi:hypothetical protein
MGATVPQEVVESIVFRDLIWLVLQRGVDPGETYLIEEVGLDQDSARTLSEYGRWAYSEMTRKNAVLKAEFCSRLEGVTTGVEQYETTRDWEPSRDRERDRLIAGVFAILSETDAGRVIEHAEELQRVTISARGDGYVGDYDTWSPERVARLIWIACEMD